MNPKKANKYNLKIIYLSQILYNQVLMSPKKATKNKLKITRI